MKKLLVGLIALMLVAASGWYFASPAIALHGLKEAAREGNAEELKERVDFPAFRESLKTQMRAKFAAELARTGGNPFGKIGAVFAIGLLDSVVDGLVTPESISAIVLQRKTNPLAKTDSDGERPDKKRSPKWSIERHGFNEFRLVGKDTSGEPAPELVFKREALSWELVGIDLSKVDLGKNAS